MYQTSLHNQLLARLAAEDFSLLAPSLEPVVLAPGRDLERANIPIEYAYFLETGIISIVATAPSGRKVEVGILGFEGMTGLAVVLGDDSSPNETFVQIPGKGFRIATPSLREALSNSRSLHFSFLRFSHSFLKQACRTALVNGQAKIEERLARWLLMVDDRVDSNKFALTHDFLATMLGVRRPSVTVALHMLEYRGLIRAHRAEISIVDRHGLIALTKGFYGPESPKAQQLSDSGQSRTHR